MPVSKRKVTQLGQPSWHFKSSNIDAYLTELGGHLAPVTFSLPRQKVQPYSVAPWATEKLDRSTPALPAILRVLRGDFFCLPFGSPSTYHGQKHSVHGDSANLKWSLQSLQRSAPVTGIHLALNTKAPKGRIDKIINLVDGDTAVYCRHIVTGMNATTSVGHHATLHFRSPGLISTSPMVHRQVYPGIMESPENKGYTLLKPGATLTSLDHVPTITGEFADLSRYPARRGYEDIVILVNDVSAPLPFAWTAVALPEQGYVWFGLKDPNVLHSTLLWHSNGGRHYAPWNGRHVDVMGLEEITGFFHDGRAASVEANSLTARGLTTSVTLHPNKPLVVNYIMGVAPIPKSFTHVASITPTESGPAQFITITSTTGQSVQTSVDLSFLQHAIDF